MFFSYYTLNSFYVHQQNVLSLYSEEAGTTMSHSGMCTAFFLGPSEPATGIGDTAEYWSVRQTTDGTAELVLRARLRPTNSRNPRHFDIIEGGRDSVSDTCCT